VSELDVKVGDAVIVADKENRHSELGFVIRVGDKSIGVQRGLLVDTYAKDGIGADGYTFVRAIGSSDNVRQVIAEAIHRHTWHYPGEEDGPFPEDEHERNVWLGYADSVIQALLAHTPPSL
jgi:hypothetical protein